MIDVPDSTWGQADLTALLNAMNALLAAIHDDDREKAKSLLLSDPALATRLIDRAKLYDSKIMHWIYAGDAALHLAAAGYRVEIARLLLSIGADPNAAHNHRQSTPLHYAADGCPGGPLYDSSRQVKMIRTLLVAGADIHAQDKNGATALHRAVRTRCAEAVEHLLSAGADPMLRNKHGSTAFHLAVQDSGRGGAGSDAARAAQRKIISIFVARGMSPQLKDGNGKSVFACARSEWIREML